MSEWARTLMREQFKRGPRPESSIRAAAEAAEIPERALIVAADALGCARSGESGGSRAERVLAVTPSVTPAPPSIRRP
jgi:hypothetical protein